MAGSYYRRSDPTEDRGVHPHHSNLTYPREVVEIEDDDREKPTDRRAGNSSSWSHPARNVRTEHRDRYTREAAQEAYEQYPREYGRTSSTAYTYRRRFPRSESRDIPNESHGYGEPSLHDDLYSSARGSYFDRNARTAPDWDMRDRGASDFRRDGFAYIDPEPEPEPEPEPTSRYDYPGSSSQFDSGIRPRATTYSSSRDTYAGSSSRLGRDYFDDYLDSPPSASHLRDFHPGRYEQSEDIYGSSYPHSSRLSPNHITPLNSYAFSSQYTRGAGIGSSSTAGRTGRYDYAGGVDFDEIAQAEFDRLMEEAHLGPSQSSRGTSRHYYY